MSNKTRLGGVNASFDEMIRRFGIVTVMNANVYNYPELNEVKTPEQFIAAAEAQEAICHLDTLKIANINIEGPDKTISGGQYSNPLIKFGKSARLEMQDALGSIKAIDALCGGVAEYDDAVEGKPYVALHFGEDFNGPKTIIGDSFFIDQKTGEQVKVKVVFYEFLPDSILNLTQDAEGDATVFDMNGDLLVVNVKIPSINGDGANAIEHGLFYSILPQNELQYVTYTADAQGVVTVAKGSAAPASSALTVDGSATPLTIAKGNAAVVELKNAGKVIYHKVYENKNV